MKRIALLSFAASMACGLAAQSNTVPGLNGRLTIVDTLDYYGRRGAAYPGGEVGMAMLNEMCNPGTVQIPWQAPMQPNHPKFGFLIMRRVNDRMEQINDWSYCKHAFTSTNYSGPCGTCQSTGGLGGSVMGINCADTYGSGNNADRNYLGPPSELNPWLGTWNPVGSYFDIGDPTQAGYPLPADGVRSLNPGSFDAVKNRVTVKEADLLTPGAAYFYGIHLMHQGEALANRTDNDASRGFTPSWNGTSWTFSNVAAAPMVYGSILQHWTGADLNSSSNGTDDGRFFVGSKATPLGGSNYHYEYAVHNVDNHRGGATLRVPIDAGAVASNFTFRDIDGNVLNNWSAARVGNEVVFTAPVSNPLNWNTVYNFGFDATFPPGNGVVSIDQARVGAGALFVAVGAKVPGGSTFAQVNTVGTGYGGANCQSSFYELFAPAAAFDLANTSMTLAYSAVTGNYTVGAGTGSYITPAGISLAMSDDTEVSTALPFTLPYPGGTTSTLYVCSNGFVSPGSNGASYTPGSAEFFSGGARWAAAWHDFLPNTGMVLVDATAARVVVSYTAVPSYGDPTATATFQYQFFPNGNVNILFQAVNTGGNDYLTGWTRGSGASDPGSMNISAGFGAGLSLCNGPTPNVALAASARPVLGTTFTFDTTNIPAGSLLGLQILSQTQYTPGLDLASIGMPGCTLYVGLDVTTQFATPTASASVPYSLPASPSLSGVLLLSQSATLSPGLNAFGFVTSNALQMVLGTN